MVELDDIDVRKVVLAEITEGSKFRIGVVDSLDEGVFVRGAPPGLINVLAHHVIEPQERVLLDPRHEHVTCLLDGGVKRDGKRKLLGFVCKTLDHRDDSTGGDGKVARTNAGALGGIEFAEGTKRGVIVHERLALPHEYHARNTCIEIVANVHDLLVDLAGGEGAGKTRGARGAKGAPHGAACLGGSTHGKLVARGHSYAFHADPVGEAQKVLATAVV